MKETKLAPFIVHLCGVLLLNTACLASAQPTALGKVETPCFRLTLSGDGRCEILDKKAKVLWRSESNQPRFGTANILGGAKPRRVELSRCEIDSNAGGFTAIFRPFPDQPMAALRVRAQALADGKTLEISYQEDREIEVQNVSLLEDVLGVSDPKGYLAVPVREGLLIPANSGLSFTNRFDTHAYEGCHMAMIGIVRNGAAALATWHDPYVAVEVKSVVNNTDENTPSQRVSPSLVLSKSARKFQIRFLGKGDYVSIAKAYREVAQERGWVETWEQKLKANPERAKLIGAINFKLWSTLDRRMNEESTKEESVRLNWTFEEAAQVAEHLKNDLKLDKVLFTLGGWIHRGYDNQHPDILPTAPECGGDAAFSDCARRVMNLGYLFCLHDNYQDIYRDSPSWDEQFVMKTSDGKLARGGHWAGGVAFLTCSRKALELAQRPQNLPAVKKLTGANSYFIDTTYASGLQECFDPAHPLTRGDDMKWKQDLSDYGRQVFGIFGSECGREWAIPHSDFFEGLTGVSGGYYHDANLTRKLGAVIVPLFELVYRDCIAMYGKYGYEPERAADYVLHHIALGRPLNHHNIPPHLYWKQRVDEAGRLPLRPGIAELKQTRPREFQVTFRWSVQKPLTSSSDGWQVFVHFTDPAGDIKFQADHAPGSPLSTWSAGDQTYGPVLVRVPENLNGSFQIRMGLFQPASGQRALLLGRDSGSRSYGVGRLKVSGDTFEYQPSGSSSQPGATTAEADLFVRAENGWAAGLHPMDRFVKNTYEVLSPLNELTARLPMTDHEFLTPDHKVQKSIFGRGREAVEVIVNTGGNDFRYTPDSGRSVILPPAGFLVDSRAFSAFCAIAYNGVQYASPALFTLRSLDHRPLSSSRRVRVYHAFGDDQVKVARKVHTVRTEEIISP